jgi:chaperonin GroES
MAAAPILLGGRKIFGIFLSRLEEDLIMAKTAVTKITVRPLHDRILVRRLTEDEKTAGGIIIPDTAKEKPQKGEVVATGKGRVTEDGKTIPLEIKAGDQVLFGKYSGTELKLNGTEYLMMREEDVLGIFN